VNHRLILRPESRLRKLTAAGVVTQVVESVPVPMIENKAESTAAS